MDPSSNYKLLNKTNVLILCFILVLSGIQIINNTGVFQMNYLSFKGDERYRQYRNGTNTVLSKEKTILSGQLRTLHARTNTNNLNCKLIFDGDKNEIKKSLSFSNRSSPKSSQYYINLTKDCNYFKWTRSYIMDSHTEEEKQFPIAYTLMLYKDVERSERLLRSIYRPQNVYCIHIDKKSSAEFKQAMEGIASCFPNVFISSRSVNVVWGEFSVLEQDLICMEYLMKYSWRYLINLTGQEFPLKTNRELVAILKALNGSNSIAGSQTHTFPNRTRYHYEGFWRMTNIRKTPPPMNVTITQGSVHIVAQRGFVHFLLHNESAIKLRNWLNDTRVPDEIFFSTLNYNPQLGAPGAYKGEAEMNAIDVPKGQYPRNPFIARFKNWGKRTYNWPCHGMRVREICIFGMGDLTLLASRKELFANKFFSSFQPEAYDCLEELHFNRTIYGIAENRQTDVTFYEHLDFVKNHV